MRLLYATVAVDERPNALAQRLVEELRSVRVLRVDREPLAQREARGGGRVPEPGDLRPRRFGIDVVEREWRDAAPVVEPGGEQVLVRRRREVRRRLQIHLRPEQQSR